MGRIYRTAVLCGLALSLAGCEMELSLVVAGGNQGGSLPRARVVARGAILPDGPHGERWRPARVAEEGLAGIYRWESWWEVGYRGR